MYTNSMLSQQDKLVLHWGAALTDGAQDSYKSRPTPRIFAAPWLSCVLIHVFSSSSPHKGYLAFHTVTPWLLLDALDL